MKNQILTALALTCIAFTACNSDEEVMKTPEKQQNTVTTLTRSAEPVDNVLSFESEEAYNALLDSLRLLDDAALLSWEAKQKDFVSLYRLKDEATKKILDAKTFEEYNQIVNEYNPYLIFNESDSEDLTAYLPIMDCPKAITLNKQGYVRIAGKLQNMKECTNFDEYSEKLAKENLAQTRAKIENGMNTVYVKANNRKFRATTMVNGVDQNTQVIRVTTKKKTILGWVEYTTKTRYRFTPTGGYAERQVASGHYFVIPRRPNGSIIYIWSRGVGEVNQAEMTVALPL